MTKGPYKADHRTGPWWVVVDTRTGRQVSYPTSKRQCASETETMNRAYAEAYAELVAEGVEVVEAIEAGEY